MSKTVDKEFLKYFGNNRLEKLSNNELKAAKLAFTAGWKMAFTEIQKRMDEVGFIDPDDFKDLGQIK